jgi:hypothetical protein
LLIAREGCAHSLALLQASGLQKSQLWPLHLCSCVYPAGMKK